MTITTNKARKLVFIETDKQLIDLTKLSEKRLKRLSQALLIDQLNIAFTELKLAIYYTPDNQESKGAYRFVYNQNGQKKITYLIPEGWLLTWLQKVDEEQN